MINQPGRTRMIRAGLSNIKEAMVAPDKVLRSAFQLTRRGVVRVTARCRYGNTRNNMVTSTVRTTMIAIQGTNRGNENHSFFTLSG